MYFALEYGKLLKVMFDHQDSCSYKFVRMLQVTQLSKINQQWMRTQELYDLSFMAM